jgi:hypothetical protein
LYAGQKQDGSGLGFHKDYPLKEQLIVGLHLLKQSLLSLWMGFTRVEPTDPEYRIQLRLYISPAALDWTMRVQYQSLKQNFYWVASPIS